MARKERPFSDLDTDNAGEQATEDVLNAFTVDRDTGLADGAGAPGSTSDGRPVHRRRDGAELSNVRPDESID